MNLSDAKMAVMMGIIGGPAAATQFLESAGGAAVGKAGLGLMDLPRAYNEETLTVTKAWGFEWPEGDNIYMSRSRSREMTRRVSVPGQWKITPTDHYMYKKLQDPSGQVRAQLMVCYQDSDAWMSVEPKYKATWWQKNYSEAEPAWPVIKDSNGNVLWVGEAAPPIMNYRAELDRFYEERRAGSNIGKMEPARSTDVAAQKAQQQLQEWNVDPNDQKWFDEGFTFPPMNDTRPAVKTYRFHSEYRHSAVGHVVDSGSCEMLASDDEEAIKLAESKATGLGNYHIKWRLYDADSNELWRKETEQPKPKRSRSSPFDDCYWGPHIGRSCY